MNNTSMYSIPDRLAVIGGGSWGTAISCHLAKKKIGVDLWAFEPEVVEGIRSARENKIYLSGISLPENIRPSSDLEEVVSGKAVVVMVTPSHVMRNMLAKMTPYLTPGVVICSLSKGVENESLMTMTQVIRDALPRELATRRACLSGPSFALEVGRGLPTAVTVASSDGETARFLQELFSSSMLRVYASQDLIGVELGGALKNVYAIAAGIADGLNLGTNARAALITRGLAEMSRLGVVMGANPLTFMGLAGVGDLVLTCTGDLSRNRTVGVKLGKGMKLNDILAEMKMVAEGVKTTRSAYDLAKKVRTEMPLAEQVYRILYEDKEPMLGLADLMSRDLKDEIDKNLSIFDCLTDVC